MILPRGMDSHRPDGINYLICAWQSRRSRAGKPFLSQSTPGLACQDNFSVLSFSVGRCPCTGHLPSLSVVLLPHGSLMQQCLRFPRLFILVPARLAVHRPCFFFHYRGTHLFFRQRANCVEGDPWKKTFPWLRSVPE